MSKEELASYAVVGFPKEAVMSICCPPPKQNLADSYLAAGLGKSLIDSKDFFNSSSGSE